MPLQPRCRPIQGAHVYRCLYDSCARSYTCIFRCPYAAAVLEADMHASMRKSTCMFMPYVLCLQLSIHYAFNCLSMPSNACRHLSIQARHMCLSKSAWQVFHPAVPRHDSQAAAAPLCHRLLGRRERRLRTVYTPCACASHASLLASPTESCR